MGLCKVYNSPNYSTAAGNGGIGNGERRRNVICREEMLQTEYGGSRLVTESVGGTRQAGGMEPGGAFPTRQ